MPIPAAPEIFLLPLSGSQSLVEDRGLHFGQRRFVKRTPAKLRPLSGNSESSHRDSTDGAPSGDNLLEHCFLGDGANAVLRVFVDLTQLEGFSGPVVLYGPPQTGKSFLARGLAQRLARLRCFRQLHATHTPAERLATEPEPIAPTLGDSESDRNPIRAIPQDRAICISAADLSVQLQDAIDTNSLSEFRNRFLRAGAIQIDDLQLLNHSPFTQSQLVILLDLLEQNGVPVVITLSKLPTQFVELRNELTSRLMGGLVLPIELPGPQAKRIALEHYASQAGVRFSADAATWIAEQAPLATFSALKGFVRELTLRLVGTKGLCDSVIELNEVIEQFAETGNSAVHRLPDLIIDTVASFFELSSEQLKGPCRRQTTVLARGLALTMLRAFCPLSLAGLGALFGNRDHSTILNALATTDDRLIKDPSLRVTLSRVMSQLKQLACQLQIPLTALPGANDRTAFVNDLKTNR